MRWLAPCLCLLPLLLVAAGCESEKVAEVTPTDLGLDDVGLDDVGKATGPEPDGAQPDASGPLPDIAEPKTYPSVQELPAQIFEGLERPAEFVIPAQYDPSQSWPLIVLLHGYNANASGNGHAGRLQDFYLQLSFRASQDGFVQLIPRGNVDPSNAQFWNATSHCCDFYGSGVDDVGYLTALLDEASTLLNIDQRKVYLVGHSNGAFMTYRMLCETPGRFAGVMTLAGAAITTCEPDAAVSVLHIHGDEDDSVLWDGEPGAHPGAEASAAWWAEQNGCSLEPEDAGVLDLEVSIDGAETTRTRYSGCDEDSLVELWRIVGGGHLPGIDDRFSAEVVQWLLARQRPEDPAWTPPPTAGEAAYGLTTPGAGGNRAVWSSDGLEGSIDLLASTPLEIPVDADTTWLAAAPSADGSVWLWTRANGDVSYVTVTDDGASAPASLSPLNPGEPPVLRVWETGAVTTLDRTNDSPLTHVLPGSILWIAQNGSLRAKNDKTGLTALLDARPVALAGTSAVLTGPTDQYAHGVLGDAIEASAITLIDADGKLLSIPIQEGAVVEGLSPMLADLDGDGVAEVIATVSDATGGARLSAWRLDGTAVGQGPPVGQGNRWRHQLAVAPLGPGGELELAVIKTPHIGGVLELYRLVDGALEIVAESAPDYRTHTIGSRNLDLALAADLHPAEGLEILVPRQSWQEWVVLKHTESGIEELGQVPLSGGVGSNLTTSAHGTGIAVGTVTATGSLMIFR
ncbi:MAG: poly(3-hydroxybutyrate) depolymerase [Myxococcota bacterium]|jgi:poly(3-hydroxybutyrate) depolymerase